MRTGDKGYLAVVLWKHVDDCWQRTWRLGKSDSKSSPVGLESFSSHGSPTKPIQIHSSIDKRSSHPFSGLLVESRYASMELTQVRDTMVQNGKKG